MCVCVCVLPTSLNLTASGCSLNTSFFHFKQSIRSSYTLCHAVICTNRTVLHYTWLMGWAFILVFFHEIYCNLGSIELKLQMKHIVHWRFMAWICAFVLPLSRLKTQTSSTWITRVLIMLWVYSGVQNSRNTSKVLFIQYILLRSYTTVQKNCLRK